MDFEISSNASKYDERSYIVLVMYFSLLPEYLSFTSQILGETIKNCLSGEVVQGYLPGAPCRK